MRDKREAHHDFTIMTVHLVPLFADQAAGEQGLRIQPAQQVEGQLQRKEAQEVTLEQRLQSIGQMTELDCPT